VEHTQELQYGASGACIEAWVLLSPGLPPGPAAAGGGSDCSVAAILRRWQARCFRLLLRVIATVFLNGG